MHKPLRPVKLAPQQRVTEHNRFPQRSSWDGATQCAWHYDRARPGAQRGLAAYKAAKGAFFPSLSISAGNTYRDGVSVNNNTGLLTPIAGAYNYTNGISTQVDVFDGGRKISELKRVSAVTEAANISVLTARFDAALQTKQQFYAALAARESEAAARAQLEQAEQQLKASTARVSAGVATKSDSLALNHSSWQCAAGSTHSAERFACCECCAYAGHRLSVACDGQSV